MYLNVNQISKDLQVDGGNTYSYNKVTNLLRGIKGNASKKEIQQIRKMIRKELTRVDTLLEKLENETSK